MRRWFYTLGGLATSGVKLPNVTCDIHTVSELSPGVGCGCNLHEPGGPVCGVDPAFVLHTQESIVRFAAVTMASLWGCPLTWHKKLRHCWPLAENFFADYRCVLQNECRLAKRKRALQECNSCRGIINRKLIETMRRETALWSFPDRPTHIGSIDFPMPEKTHTASCREAASLQLFAVSRFASNSEGGTWPKAECSRFWL